MSTPKTEASTGSCQSIEPTLEDDFIWFVEISEMPAHSFYNEGPFTTKTAALARIDTELQRQNPGEDGLQKFDEMMRKGVFWDDLDMNFEVPMSNIKEDGKISFQLTRQNNETVKVSKSLHAFTILRVELDMEFDSNINEQVLSVCGLKPEKAFTSKEEAEFFLSRHTFTLREPDMKVAVGDIEGDHVGMLWKPKLASKVYVLAVAESHLGCVAKSPDLSADGPVFRKPYFGEAE